MCVCMKQEDGSVEKMLEDLSSIPRTYIGSWDRLGGALSICKFMQMETGPPLSLTVQKACLWVSGHVYPHIYIQNRTNPHIKKLCICTYIYVCSPQAWIYTRWVVWVIISVLCSKPSHSHTVKARICSFQLYTHSLPLSHSSLSCASRLCGLISGLWVDTPSTIASFVISTLCSAWLTVLPASHMIPRTPFPVFSGLSSNHSTGQAFFGLFQCLKVWSGSSQVEYLPTMFKAVGLIPSTIRKLEQEHLEHRWALCSLPTLNIFLPLCVLVCVCWG